MPAARVEQKNGMTKEDKNGVIPPLTKKAPYKPDAMSGYKRLMYEGKRWTQNGRRKSAARRPSAGEHPKNLTLGRRMPT